MNCFFGGMQEPCQNTCLPKAIGNVQNLLAGRSATCPKSRKSYMFPASLLFRFDMHCCNSSPFICCEIHGWGMIWHRWLRLQWSQFVLAKRDWNVKMVGQVVVIKWSIYNLRMLKEILGWIKSPCGLKCVHRWALLESLVHYGSL